MELKIKKGNAYVLNRETNAFCDIMASAIKSILVVSTAPKFVITVAKIVNITVLQYMRCAKLQNYLRLN